MALYRQLKFPSTFIEYRCVNEWKGVVVTGNFDSLEAALQIYRPRQLPSLPRPQYAPDVGRYFACKVPYQHKCISKENLRLSMLSNKS